MKTRDKILQTARLMFNKQGIDGCSARMIAAEMNISDGNLRYYFRTKEDLVYALYMQLADDFTQQFATYDTTVSRSLEQVYQSIYSVYAQLYEHRYLMADFMAIMRKYPNIEEHYRALVEQRKRQFIHVIDILKKTGILKDELPPHQYGNLIEQFYVFSDAWIGQAEVFLKEATHEEKVKHYSQLAFSMIAPYLTSLGWQQYEQVSSSNVNS